MKNIIFLYGLLLLFAWSKGFAQTPPVVRDGSRYLLLTDTVVGNAGSGLRFDPGMVPLVGMFSFDMTEKKALENQASMVFREPERTLHLGCHFSLKLSGKERRKPNPTKRSLWDLPIIMAAELLSPQRDGDWEEHLDRFRERQAYPDFFRND